VTRQYPAQKRLATEATRWHSFTRPIRGKRNERQPKQSERKRWGQAEDGATTFSIWDSVENHSLKKGGPPALLVGYSNAEATLIQRFKDDVSFSPSRRTNHSGNVDDLAVAIEVHSEGTAGRPGEISKLTAPGLPVAYLLLDELDKLLFRTERLVVLW
jgi:hypothetical protein